MRDATEALEAAALICDAYQIEYYGGREESAANALQTVARKIRGLIERPFRVMESNAGISLPKRLDNSVVEKAALELMSARSWHLEAFACAFFREAGARQASKFKLVEERKVDGDRIITTWRWEAKWVNPPEENPAPPAQDHST